MWHLQILHTYQTKESTSSKIETEIYRLLEKKLKVYFSHMLACGKSY